MKRLALLGLVVLAAGCGGQAAPRATTSTTARAPSETPRAAMEALIASDHALAGSVRTLYVASGWAVVQSTAPGRASAVAFRLVGGRWRAERSRAVTISILGPRPGGTGLVPVTQVAIEARAQRPFVETAIWVDGSYLANLQGGGNTSGTQATIYGSPARRLRRGVHVAVGYARTASAASAVAWLFRIP